MTSKEDINDINFHQSYHCLFVIFLTVIKALISVKQQLIDRLRKLEIELPEIYNIKDVQSSQYSHTIKDENVEPSLLKI